MRKQEIFLDSDRYKYYIVNVIFRDNSAVYIFKGIRKESDTE